MTAAYFEKLSEGRMYHIPGSHDAKRRGWEEARVAYLEKWREFRVWLRVVIARRDEWEQKLERGLRQEHDEPSMMGIQLKPGRIDHLTGEVVWDDEARQPVTSMNLKHGKFDPITGEVIWDPDPQVEENGECTK